jgi:hypothetical protein
MFDQCKDLIKDRLLGTIIDLKVHQVNELTEDVCEELELSIIGPFIIQPVTN